MMLERKKEKIFQNLIWVIKEEEAIDPDGAALANTLHAEPVKTYRISDLAGYLLNPNPVEITKKLVGCRIVFRQSRSNQIKEKLREKLSGRMKDVISREPLHEDIMMTQDRNDRLPVRDVDLKEHINKIDHLLRPYYAPMKRLMKLDQNKTADIVGLCDDFGGSRSLLNLQGTISDKIRFIHDFIDKEVRVVINKAYLSNGLFEMRGFDFECFDFSRSSLLVKLYHNGMHKHCVLNADGRVDFWIAEPKLVRCMQLLEHSIRTDSALCDAFIHCVQGNAKPLKLFFNQQLNIDYSEVNLPKLYKKVFDVHRLGTDEITCVLNSLKSRQLGISFNSMPRLGKGQNKMLTSISVMHDVNALEPIRHDLPDLYSEIKKMAALSEGGKFYLLDSIRGYYNAQ